MSRVLLDTNAYIAYLAGDSSVLDALGRAETVYLPVIVMGELFAGFAGGTQAKKNRGYLETFLKKSTVEVLNVTVETAEIFGEIKDQLKKAGSPIPINDVWIAALAVETGSRLVTYDAHFKQVPGLRLWNK